MRKYGSSEETHVEVDNEQGEIRVEASTEGGFDERDVVALAEENRAVDGTD